ncbi:MAG: M20/M25/M40 family metallo-hydrolase, partial [Sphingomicrobium sp.]
MTGLKQFGLIAVVALLLAAFALKGMLILPPSPPSAATGEGFDSERALARLKRVLGDQRPHPVDSAANDAVRARLVAELTAIGLSPEVREAMDCNVTQTSRSVGCAMTRNVVASLGPASGRRLLLNAHYDSTPTGPGASDDGLGVATLLEVAAELLADPPARPVSFLFNEGEEFGLNGARAFVASDPLARDVDSLINIDTRGVSGPALMFETNAPNGPALADYARAAQRPYANSVSADFATLIPNTTDVTVFKERGWKTLSYSIIGNETRYHSPGDTIDALDRRSLYHVGSEILAATRVVADDQGASSKGRRVFTDIAGRWFVSLPLMLAGVALGLILLGTGLLAWRGKALGRSLAIVAIAAFGATITAAIVVTFVGLLRPSDYWRATPLTAYLAVYATVLAVEVALLMRLARNIERARLRIAAWLLILSGGSALSLVMPGATIFFLAPPLIALGAMLAANRSPTLATALFWTAGFLQLLLFAELLALIELLLVDGPLFAVAPLAALAALPLLVEVLAPERSRRALEFLMGAVMILWASALVMLRVNDERPGGLTISYVRDEISGRNVWAVANKQAPLPAALARLGRWRDIELIYNGRHRWVTNAPAIEIPRPSIRFLSSVANGKDRVVRLMLVTGGSDTISLRFDKQVALVAAGLDGAARDIPGTARPGPSALSCSGRAC